MQSSGSSGPDGSWQSAALNDSFIGPPMLTTWPGFSIGAPSTTLMSNSPRIRSKPPLGGPPSPGNGPWVPPAYTSLSTASRYFSQPQLSKPGPPRMVVLTCL